MGTANGATDTWFAPGELVAGHLLIEAQLGHGGAGTVYRVCDQRSGRKLALKQLQVVSEDKRALVTSLFEREYHTLVQLAHPRIIEVYDYGVERGQAYYTMELLDGEDLRERGKLHWRQACALLCDVASSLAILHSRKLVHRDVSARNVRCTSDGRAKLIDFGAMSPMAASKHLVGTPPFVPPEALQLQELDGRADLYSLGAVAYWVLTGRYAFPARSMQQLQDLWRKPPTSPRQLEPEIPEALDQLVMALLRLERSGRPSNAAEVMERLSGIAGLPLVELPEVSRAYLVTPTLVGRETALQSVRTGLIGVRQRPEGVSFLIEGAAGMGCSRFLDACVLEAKLLGAVVLRGGAADSAAGDYGLASALARQLQSALPELCDQAVQPRRALLAQLLPELAPPVSGRPCPSTPSAASGTPAASAAQQPTASERRHLQAALRDWWLTIARIKPLVIAIDDLAAVDEPSAALLGALAHGAGRRHMALLVTSRSGPAESAVHALLREIATPIALQPLTPPQTEALLRSVFGDVDHVSELAAHVHRLAEGSPGWTMALCERLVELGIARYEAGRFSLPAQLPLSALPESLEATLQARIDALGPDARELGEALALTDPGLLTLPDFPSLSDHGARGRCYRALDQLVEAGVLVAEGERYRFAQPRFRQLLAAALGPERQRELHARIARAIAGAEDPAVLPHHLLLSGQQREGVERLLAQYDNPRMMHAPLTTEVLGLAVNCAEKAALPLRTQLELRAWLLEVAGLRGEHATFVRHAEPLLAQLMRDSGLYAYQALDPELPPAERIARAIALAQQHYDQTPELERGLPPREAVPQLVRVCSAISVSAVNVYDVALTKRLPSLEPLFPISPGAMLIEGQLAAQRASITGRWLGAGAGGAAEHEFLRSLQAPGHAGLHPVHAKFYRLMCMFAFGRRDATWGIATALEWANELDKEPGHRGDAWRIRALHELAHGNTRKASEYRRRADLLALQDGGTRLAPNATVVSELLAHAAVDDVLGVKRSLESIEPLAATYPGWQPYLALARCEYKRVQGDLAGALAALELALPDVLPGSHAAWGELIVTRVALLHALGRRDEAFAIGIAAVEISGREQLVCRPSLLRVTAEALAASGRPEQALPLAEECVGIHRMVLSGGVEFGRACEARARVAIAASDPSAFLQYAELCAAAYEPSQNPALSTRSERLQREAEAAGVVSRTEPKPTAEPGHEAIDDEVARTVYSRLITCVSPLERAREVLRLLLEASGAHTGYIYGLRAGQLTLLSNAEAEEPAPTLQHILERYLRNELESDGAATRIDESPPGARGALDSWLDDDRREFEPLLLRGSYAGEGVIAGVAALHYPGDERTPLRRAVLEALTSALISDDAVDPVTCVA